jgi:hypothetical protein
VISCETLRSQEVMPIVASQLSETWKVGGINDKGPKSGECVISPYDSI